MHDVLLVEDTQGVQSLTFGGAAGAFARRHALKSLPRCVQVNTSRGRALNITFNGRLSSRGIIATYAKHKRVGCRFLQLDASHNSGFCRSLRANSSKHLISTWNGFKLVVTNRRYSMLKATDPHSASAHEALWHTMNESFAAQLAAQDATAPNVPRHDDDIRLELAPNNSGDAEDEALQQISEDLDQHEAELHNLERPSSERTVQLAISILGHVTVPARWTLPDVHSWLKQVHNINAACASIFIARKKVSGARPTSIVSGGAGSRKLRIPRESVSQAALNTVLADLPTFRAGLLVEHALVKRMIEWDPRLSRTIFQAKSAGERLKLLAKTMQGSGLSSMAYTLMKDAIGMLDPNGEVPSDEVIRACLLPTDGQVPDDTAVNSLHEEQLSQPNTAAGRKTKIVLQDDVKNRLVALEQWAHEIDKAAHSTKGRVATGCSLECLTRIAKVEEAAKHWNLDAVPPTQPYESQDLATQDPYLDQPVAQPKKRGRPRANSVVGEHGDDLTGLMQQQAQQYSKLEMWCHQTIARLEAQIDAMARER
eukprot:6489457-Amphidinium_carterae.1